ncbi:MAG: NADH-quinone oxidoreductase subunit J [Nannocystaceae bacterium]|nr:NADH-quinone oxidoreductase subunit J [Nannocystaceae bacterium]
MAVVSALFTVTRRNPVVAAVWLVASFFAVAVCYVLLSASFIAVLQVLVYAGAMMVLFVFVIMVLDVSETGEATHRRPTRVRQLGYYGAVVVGVGLLFWVLSGTLARQFLTPGADLRNQPEFGSADAVGRVLFGQYLFAFEAISMLLLAAVIGAVVVARSRRDREREAKDEGMDEATREAAGLDPQETPAAPGLIGPTPAHDYGAPSAGGHEGGV